jgi:hypothetical protein
LIFEAVGKKELVDTVVKQLCELAETLSESTRKSTSVTDADLRKMRMQTLRAKQQFLAIRSKMEH